MKAGCVVLLALVALCGFGWLNYYYESVIAKNDADQLRTERDGQAAHIAQTAFIFNQFNQITAANEADRVKRDAVTADTVIKYREILKRVPATNELVPVSVSGGLCETASRLRADTMRSVTGQPDSVGRNSSDPCKLTYRQAVLWLAPLLSALDEANRKLADIRAADAVRAGAANKVNK